MDFSVKIIDWYRQNKRALPWRKAKDPYKIWLSEVILQQTRIDQGTAYYHEFIEVFPTVEDLAKASEIQVLKLWQGLGYYSRARNLHKTAKIIVSHHQGRFPRDYNALRALPGIGDYTASAIGSICFGLPTATVDGNVYRLLSRFFGIDTPINTPKAQKEFKALAQFLLVEDQVSDFNQGMMEFGALVCKPKKPACDRCVLAQACVALRDGLQEKLPQKLIKPKSQNRYLHFIVAVDPDKKTYFVPQNQKGIWHKMYTFPFLETDAHWAPNQIDQFIESQNLSGEPKLWNPAPILHKLTHQNLHLWFWILKTPSLLKDAFSFEQWANYPLPKPIDSFVKQYWKKKD